jgi:hypothetical protein
MPQMNDGNPSTGDPGNRPDMFAGRYKPRAIVGQSSFDPTSRAYQRQRAMIAVRRAFTPLRRGEQWVRFSNPSGPGGYIFSRIHGTQEVVVAINTSDRAIDLRNVYVDRDLTRPGTDLVDALDDGYTTQTIAAGEGSQMSVNVPPRSVRVLVARQLYDEKREQIAHARSGDGPTGVEPDEAPVSVPARLAARTPARVGSDPTLRRAAATQPLAGRPNTPGTVARTARVAERPGFLRAGGRSSASTRNDPRGSGARPWRPMGRLPFVPRR